MKLQAIGNVPHGKQQTRRKAPKIAPLIALAALLLTVIPVYYPLMQYTHKHFFQSLANVIRPHPLLVPLLHTHLQHGDGPPNPTNTNPNPDVVTTIPSSTTTTGDPKRQLSTRDVEGLSTSTPSPPRDRHRNPVSLQHRSDEKKAVLASPSTPTQPSVVIQQFARNVKGLPSPVTPRHTDLVGMEHNGDKKISVMERQSRTATRNAKGLSSSARRRDKHLVNRARRRGKRKGGTKKPSNLVIQQPTGNVSSAMRRDKHLVGFQKKRDHHLVIQQPTSNVTGLSAGGSAAKPHEDLVMNTNTLISSSGDVKGQGSAKTHEDLVMNTNTNTNTLISSSRDVMSTPRMQESSEKCDIFCGEWVPNVEAPYYTNQTCWAIQDHQNCMKYERPDTQFMKWRWKPDGCELPIFDPIQFLELVRGKSLAFVGDSVARNHMQSLICLLSKVT